MSEYFLAPGSTPFTAALLIMAGLFVFELLALFKGLGINEAIDDFVVSSVDLPDDVFDVGELTTAETASGIEGSSTPEGGSLIGRLLAWLYVGRVPVLMVLVVFLTIFGLAGLIIQSMLRQSIGMAVPGVIAAPAVFFLTLPMVRWCTGGLARVLPKEETSAVSTATFIGKTAVVVGGNARRGLPAQARLIDRFRTTHYVLVEPEDENDVLEQGSLVLLVRRINGKFSAIPNPNAALVADTTD
ncbi:MAG: YqiJ family protein [Wenzhouxiangella sp.]|nr:YqiJ family protein [Wenzhouxiangella sp.]MCH8477950.1 YqiJ family protein [Wenzhouxiangella sp.]TVR95850.1 MAG: DUF1449 family protein [Wenzhouxiangellaceae bacterium]